MLTGICGKSRKRYPAATKVQRAGQKPDYFSQRLMNGWLIPAMTSSTNFPDNSLPGRPRRKPSSDCGNAGGRPGKVKNMIKNRRLAKAISDAGWSSLITKMEYKARQEGKHLVKIDQWFPSSKTCSCCGLKQAEMPLKIRSWVCSCGAMHDRDINAAGNIRQKGILKLKAEGHSVSADGGLRGRRSGKSGLSPVAA